jgi:hypothetical protein
LHGVAAKPYKASKFKKAPQKIVAKQASASYTPEATTWVKIKNSAYSQAIGREDLFDRRRAAAK